MEGEVADEQIVTNIYVNTRRGQWGRVNVTEYEGFFYEHTEPIIMVVFALYALPQYHLSSS